MSKQVKNFAYKKCTWFINKSQQNIPGCLLLENKEEAFSQGRILAIKSWVKGHSEKNGKTDGPTFKISSLMVGKNKEMPVGTEVLVAKLQTDKCDKELKELLPKNVLLDPAKTANKYIYKFISLILKYFAILL